MAQVAVGYTCPEGHFTWAFDCWEPVKDTDIDKQAERRAIPSKCEGCGADLEELPHVEGRERESPHPSRAKGRNIPAGLPQGRRSPRPKEGPLTPLEWRRRVFERQRPRPNKPSLCAVTGEPLDFQRDDCHHPLEKRLLRARGLHAHVWDPRNAVFVKAYIHTGHTFEGKKIPREALPDAVWEFAEEIGPWAVLRIQSDHPSKED